MATARVLRAGAGALVSGSAVAALRCSNAEAAADQEHAIAQLRKQADKARQRAHERVRVGEEEVLGMTPKLLSVCHSTYDPLPGKFPSVCSSPTRRCCRRGIPAPLL